MFELFQCAQMYVLRDSNASTTIMSFFTTDEIVYLCSKDVHLTTAFRREDYMYVYSVCTHIFEAVLHRYSTHERYGVTKHPAYRLFVQQLINDKFRGDIKFCITGHS